MKTFKKIITIFLASIILSMNLATYPMVFAYDPDPRDWIDSSDTFTSDITQKATTLTAPAPVNGIYFFGSYPSSSPTQSNAAYINVNDSYISQSDRYVKIKFWYYNEGTSDTYVHYRSTNNDRNINKNETDPNVLPKDYRQYSFKRGGTDPNTWKQAVVYLDDIKFDNGLRTSSSSTTGRFDFRLLGYSSKVCFGKVEIEKVDNAIGDQWYKYDRINFTEKSDPNAVIAKEVENIYCREISKSKTLGFNINASYGSSADQYAKLKFLYLDNGTDNIEFKYQSTTGGKTVVIPRQNTNQWIEKELYLEDAKFDNNLSVSTVKYSFGFYASGNSPTYIGKVDMQKVEPDPLGIWSVDKTHLEVSITQDSDLAHYNTVTEKEGIQCRKVAGGKELLLSVNQMYITPSLHKNVKIKFWYYDVGTEKIALKYIAQSGEKPLRYIQKTNTGKWMEAQLIIEDANFYNDPAWANGSFSLAAASNEENYFGKIDNIKTEYVISNVSLNVDSKPASVLIPGKVFQADMTITNATEDEKKVIYVVAFYDSKNRMTKLALQPYTLTVGNPQVMSKGFVLPANIVGSRVETFVWDGEDLQTSSMNLLTEVYSISDTVTDR